MQQCQKLVSVIVLDLHGLSIISFLTLPFLNTLFHSNFALYNIDYIWTLYMNSVPINNIITSLRAGLSGLSWRHAPPVKAPPLCDSNTNWSWQKQILKRLANILLLSEAAYKKKTTKKKWRLFSPYTGLYRNGQMLCIYQ